MREAGDTVALIVAAGKGERVGGSVPKQFQPLRGRPMIAHSVEALARHPRIDRVVVVIAAGQEDALRDAVGDVAFVHGGTTRRRSVAYGLAALAERPPGRVLIHDAARPFVPPDVVDRLLAALETAPGAVPGLPVADTLVRRSGETVDRAGLFRVQTPQAFAFDVVKAAHDAWDDRREATDDAQMVRDAGYDVAIVPGDPGLEKITHAHDLQAMNAPSMIARSASGYDVHRLEAGEELWLGGVLIPHDKGLSGHSDADVGLHAVTDALLGTIGAGDIGLHFPPSDPKWRGAESGQFLRHAADLVRGAGGTIDFVDLTLICEAPKIGPHRVAIRARIADLLQIKEGQVSVKATTTERLGFTGRGEGIAAQAVATVRVPEVAA